MAHLGLYCPAETGHLHTMLPLGQALQTQGHRVTFYGVLDAEPQVQAAGIHFQALGKELFPQGSSTKIFTQLGQLKGLAALRFTLHWLEQAASVFLSEAPELLREAKVDALIIDQITPEGGTVADYLDVPFITLCSALPCNQESGIPPLFTTWPYRPNWWTHLRNRLVYQATNPFGASLKQLRTQYRRQWRLPPEISPDSQLAILSHQPAAFAFPRHQLPPWFHFTGPYHTQASRKPVDFPWERLDQRPLIYASMGTLQNQLTNVFEIIATACMDLDAQLVISLGGAAQPEAVPDLPGQPVVVHYAPQLALLQQAALVITHAGMNTVLEALTHGVPMVTIPITNDQPGIAARVAWLGAGELLPLKQLQPQRLHTRIQAVLTQPSYKQKALTLQAAIQQSGGVRQAVSIIEQAITTRQPVYRTDRCLNVSHEPTMNQP